MPFEESLAEMILAVRRNCLICSLVKGASSVAAARETPRRQIARAAMGFLPRKAAIRITTSKVPQQSTPRADAMQPPSGALRSPGTKGHYSPLGISHYERLTCPIGELNMHSGQRNVLMSV